MRVATFYLVAILTLSIVAYGVFTVVIAPKPSGGCSLGICF